MYMHPMWLDRKLYEDVQVNFDDAVTNPDMFGVEIELEGKNLRSTKRDIVALWDIHNDNSLRIKNPGEDAIEYVLRRPLNLENTEKALFKLFDHLNQPDVQVFPSYRTSIHVHVNCGADTWRHVFNFMTLALIFDELFVSQNGDHRIGNNFCLRARDAQGQIDSLVKSIQHHGNIFNLNQNQRYSSVNFVSLMKFGTLEFRSLECTTDLQRVEHWIETLATLKAAARQFDDPQDIIRYFSRMSAKEFLYFVLGHSAAFYAKVEGFEQMLRDGMRLAQDLAYSSKWVAREEKDKEPPPKPAKKKAPNLNPGFAQAMAQLQNIQAAEPGQIQVVQGPGGGQNWILQGNPFGAPGANNLQWADAVVAPQAQEEWN